MSSFEELWRVSLSVNLDYLNSDMISQNKHFSIVDFNKDHNPLIGELLFSPQVANPSLSCTPVFGTALKRKISNEASSQREAKVLKSPTANRIQNPKTVKKDVGSILQDLNIVPEIPDGLQCALCPYKATVKPSLKTHYQLKHLGGIGLSVHCTICQQKFSMKKSAKRHMMSVHNLSNENASKLLD